MVIEQLVQTIITFLNHFVLLVVFSAPIIYDSYDHEGQQSMTTWYNIVNGVDDLHIEFPTGISTVAALKTYLETNVQGV